MPRASNLRKKKPEQNSTTPRASKPRWQPSALAATTRSRRRGDPVTARDQLKESQADLEALESDLPTLQSRAGQYELLLRKARDQAATGETPIEALALAETAAAAAQGILQRHETLIQSLRADID